MENKDEKAKLRKREKDSLILECGHAEHMIGFFRQRRTWLKFDLEELGKRLGEYEGVRMRLKKKITEFNEEA